MRVLNSSKDSFRIIELSPLIKRMVWQITTTICEIDSPTEAVIISKLIDITKFNYIIIRIRLRVGLDFRFANLLPQGRAYNYELVCIHTGACVCNLLLNYLLVYTSYILYTQTIQYMSRFRIL